MKTYMKSLIASLLLFPLWGSAQEIPTILKYINQQFEMYNEYETSFDVDLSAKEVICEDRFGILKAKFSDVKFDYSGSNFGIYCLSEDKCIRYYDKDGSRKYNQDYNSYTMGLRLDDDIIPHIDAVISKFSELKTAVLSSSSSGSGSGSPNAAVEVELRKINAIFQRSSEYKNTYYVDYSQNAIVSKTQNCKAIIPVKSGLRLYYYKRDGGTYSYGFYFENSDKSILESCTSFEDYTEKTYEYVNNYSDAQSIVTSLNKIISILNNSSTSSTPSYSSSSSIDTKLRYINQQFADYNKYNTVWSINYNTKQLIWKNDFGTNTVSFKDCEVRADYQNGWIGVYCLNSDSECIVQVTNSGSKDYYKQYTMSLNDNDGTMISHMSKVIGEFAAIKNAVLNGTPSPSTVTGSDEPDDEPDK